MKHLKLVTTYLILTIAVFLASDVLRPRDANSSFREMACGSFIAGTYVMTLSDKVTGVTPPQWVITFFPNHKMSVTKAAVEGVSANPLDHQGKWECAGRRKINATALDFDHPDGAIAQLDYQAAFAGQGAKAQKVQGTIMVNLFFDATEDPLKDDASTVRKYIFKGERVTTD